MVIQSAHVTLKFDEWPQKNNKAPLLYYIKLRASFQIHRWIQTGVTVRRRSIWVKIGNFLSRMTLKFDGWPWKTIGHLFYTTLSFVQHLKAIGTFKLQLLSGNAQFGEKIGDLKDDLEKQYGTSSILRQALCVISNPSGKPTLNYSPETLNSGQNWYFLSRVTLKFDGWPWKTIGHLSYAASSFVHHFIAIGEFKLELQSGNAQFGLGQNRQFF